MCDEVNGESKVPKSSGAPDTMEIGFRGLWEVEIDDNIDCLNVNASCEEIYKSIGTDVLGNTSTSTSSLKHTMYNVFYIT